MIRITELSVGQNFSNMYAFCTAASVRKTTKNTNYLDATFYDGQQSINAKMWDWPTGTPIEANEVYGIAGTVGEYKGTKQLTLTNIAFLGNITQQKREELYTMFTPNRGFNVEELWKHLHTYADIIDSKPMRSFVDELVFNNEERWKAATAAIKMHHVQAGGLLQHTVEVVSFVNALFTSTYIPEPVNRDLLIAGAILHDIGKLETYKLDKATFTMTLPGILRDHTAIGFHMLMTSQSAAKYGSIAALLGHIILSHHGTLEHGAAVKPAFLEAYLVSVADKMSADMDMYSKAYREASSLTDTLSFYSDTFNKSCLTPYYVFEQVKATEVKQSADTNNR